jgi:hypothetical protein
VFENKAFSDEFASGPPAASVRHAATPHRPAVPLRDLIRNWVRRLMRATGAVSTPSKACNLLRLIVEKSAGGFGVW